ncbi:MAG: DUF2279 domain-containing protein [Bacteroidales bacterium]
MRKGIIPAMLFVLFLAPTGSRSQNHFFTPSDTLNKARFTGLLIGATASYSAVMFGLYQLWYKNYPQSSFHFKNDNSEWLQMDKAGHSTTAYYLGRVGYSALKWAGVENKKAIWLGGSAGWIFLTTVEIFDGFSGEWGASAGDVIANTAGAALFIGQQFLWQEQKLILKCSYHPTGYAQHNPAQLGENHLQRVLKDYNGQTYWISANLKSLFAPRSKLPSWLNISLGYGAKAMTGPDSNPVSVDGTRIPSFDRTRQFYLSPDIDLTRIRTRSGFLKTLLTAVSVIKIPLPAIEYDPGGKMKFHWAYF